MAHSERWEQYLGVNLSTPIKEIVDDNTTYCRYTAGHTMLRQGEPAPGVFLLLHGVVRGYYIDEDGREATKCFAAEGEFFSTEGLRTGGVSSFCIESLTPCECLLLPYTLVEAACASQPELGERVDRLFRAEVNRLEGRARTMLMLDAEARYRAFMAAYPRLQSRVPLRHVASYIGVRPETLSRIRKKAPRN